MMEKLRGNTIRQWFASFVYSLQDEAARKLVAKDPAIAADPATLWSPRSANSNMRYH
jgi:hypothetical protein